MAISSYPWDTVDTTETQYTKLFRHLRGTGVLGAAGGTSLRVQAGTGMNLSVQAGSAILRGHYVEITGPESVTIPAAGASARVDTVVLRLNPTANSITLAVVSGAVANVATNPLSFLNQTDTGNFEIPLANVAVGASVTSIVSGNIVDWRQWSGSEVAYWNVSTRPPSTAYPAGTLGWNYSTNKLEVWNGTSVAPVLSTITAADISDPQNLSVGSATTASKIAGRTLFVQKTEPAGAVDGDLWFSWT